MESIQDLIKKVSPHYAKRAEKVKKKIIPMVPEIQQELMLDSPSETLEPTYFLILDLMTQLAGKTEKLVDNFESTVGSGHFGELIGRATHMQKQGMEMMGMINTVIRTVLNLIYDLKEIELRLAIYENAKAKDPTTKNSGVLSLKQIWMDNVDIKKGVGSINNLTVGNLSFVTLRDAFMYVNNEKDVQEVDLNDRVKRILSARISEFHEWVGRSEKELTKRFQIEKTYLRSQVSALKLYSRWARPYLKAATDLEQSNHHRDADLVKNFNTILLELTLLGKRAVDINQEVTNRTFPKNFSKAASKRAYYTCVLVDFKFRGVPGRISQRGDYSFGGRASITFQGYVLNEDEIKKLDQELKDSDLESALGLIENMTTESIGQLKEDIEHYLEEDKKKDEKEKKPEGSNPFFALLGFYDKKEKDKDKDKKGNKADEKIDKITPDNFAETIVREFAIENTKEKTFQVYDVFKKISGRASYT